MSTGRSTGCACPEGDPQPAVAAPPPTSRRLVTPRVGAWRTAKLTAVTPDEQGCPQAASSTTCRPVDARPYGLTRWPSPRTLSRIVCCGNDGLLRSCSARTSSHTSPPSVPRRAVPSAVRSSGEQAHVPAQQSSSIEDSRLSPADADPGGAGDSGSTAPQGPRLSLGLTGSCSRAGIACSERMTSGRCRGRARGGVVPC